MAYAATGAQGASHHPNPAPPQDAPQHGSRDRDPEGPRGTAGRGISRFGGLGRIGRTGGPGGIGGSGAFGRIGGPGRFGRLLQVRLRVPRAAAVLVASLLVALLLPLALPVPAAEAAGCGTNWSSRWTPPKTVRVLRTDTGHVEVVPFRTYVAEVMASGEFPTYLPKSVLEAGATAVKQYAWYYALKGHHRDNYRTASGVCYDLRNDTNDQLYRPAKANPTGKQQRAIKATWGLTLRKGGRFFLTGYRAGNASRCASDADGWRLYAKSMVDCAEHGWSRHQIQSRYYAPKIKFVWRHTPDTGPGDKTAPTLSVPEAEPKRGDTIGDRMKVTVSWTGRDDSGIERYTVQRRVDGGAWQAMTLDSKRSTSVESSVAGGHRYQFRVKALDKAGNATEFIRGPVFKPAVKQSGGAKLWGSWAAQRDGGASAGGTSYSTDRGAKAILEFDGVGVGIVAPRGPGHGRAQIRVDGVVAEVIDLNAGSAYDRRVVFSRSWPTRGHHTVSLEVLGTQNRPRVDVDAFVVLR